MPGLETWDPQTGFDKPVILVYGASGVGKTYWASSAPRPIFLDVERGMASIKREGVGRWEINSVNDLRAAVKWLNAENFPDQTGYQTVVVDSLNEVQRLFNDHVLTLSPDAGRRPFDGQQMNQGDWGLALNMLEKFVRSLKTLDMSVVLLCGTSGVVGAEGKVEPALYGKNTVGMVARYMDVVGYMELRRNAEAKTTERVMSFELPTALSKDRSGALTRTVKDPTWDTLAAYWSPKQEEKEKQPRRTTRTESANQGVSVDVDATAVPKPEAALAASS